MPVIHVGPRMGHYYRKGGKKIYITKQSAKALVPRAGRRIAKLAKYVGRRVACEQKAQAAILRALANGNRKSLRHAVKKRESCKKKFRRSLMKIRK